MMFIIYGKAMKKGGENMRQKLSKKTNKYEQSMQAYTNLCTTCVCNACICSGIPCPQCPPNQSFPTQYPTGSNRTTLSSNNSFSNSGTVFASFHDVKG